VAPGRDMSEADDMTVEEVKTLKVAELKEQLGQLDAPTTGLKAELASRLAVLLTERLRRRQERCDITKDAPQVAAPQIVAANSEEGACEGRVCTHCAVGGLVAPQVVCAPCLVQASAYNQQPRIVCLPS
jgi:hypothetical protein